MIKKIAVLPRRVVRQIIDGEHQLPLTFSWAPVTLCSQPWALISICTQPSEKLLNDNDLEKLHELGCQKTLTQYFGDYSNLEYWKTAAAKYQKKIYIFNESHAQEIIQFLEAIHAQPEELSLVVHCDAGISRSGAVGIFACRYFGLDEMKFREINNNIHPNPLVYNQLYETSGLKSDYEIFWETTLETAQKNKKIRFT